MDWDALIDRARAGDYQAIESLAAAPLAVLPSVESLIDGAAALGRAALADTIAEIAAVAPASGVPPLLRLLSDGDELVRSHAAAGLGALGDGAARVALEERLRQDVSALVRASAAEALGDLGDPAARATLHAALGDADAAVRGYAANAIGLLGVAADDAALAAAVAAESVPEVRAELLGARWRLGATTARGALLDLLAGADESLAINVLNVIEDLCRRAPPADLGVARAEVESALAAFAARLPSVRDVERVRRALLGAAT